MKFLKKHIFLSGLCLGILGLSSCRDDVEAALDAPDKIKEGPRVTITISPISLGGANDDIAEMIRTLRIIMVSETTDDNGKEVSYIEFNHLVDFEDGEQFSGTGEYASKFRYVFTRPTVAGVKKFYLVANEGSVTPVSFQTEEDLPEGVSNGMTLSTFLDLYTPNYIPGYENLHGVAPGTGEPKGAEFQSLINCLYYTPNFVPEQEGTEIFLPYSSFYQYTVSDPASEEEDSPPVNVMNETMYLVPAANKFTFRLRNYRPSAVIIENFKISGMSTDMFLFAQVNQNDLYKELNKAKLWWIDWLEAVSRLSYPAAGGFPSGPESESFNQAYGWISDFEVPATAMPEIMDEEINEELRHGVYDFIEEGNPWSVDSRDMNYPINEAPPGTAQTGYFYLPESKNLVTQDFYDENGDKKGEIQVQRYYITLTMHDTKEGSPTVSKDTSIGNLGSMFRNNNTLITVTLRDALDVGAYATPEDWKVHHSFGNVIEENK